MGANKTKINKNLLNRLVIRTKRSPAEIKAMHTIFFQHFPNGAIESPQDLWRCLQKFCLWPKVLSDTKVAERLYRLFNLQERGNKPDGPIDFFDFILVSSILEHGSARQKAALYFNSFDVNNDRLITRDDLEACLPATVESQQLIQQLLKQWDMNKDGVVSVEDFERYVLANPNLLQMFADENERVRIDSVNALSTTTTSQYTNQGQVQDYSY